jgi:uncharacterized protein
LLFHSISNGQNSGERKQIQAYSSLPGYIGYVNDFEDILSPDQEQELNKIISEFEKQTTNQIAIVSVDSISPYTSMKDYATDLANKWGVGQKDKDNGLVIIISKKLRQSRIATGLGTEKILTDQICQRITEQRMIPQFKNGDYFKGIREGLTELIKTWK